MVGFLDRLRRADSRPDDILEQVLLVPIPDTGEPPRGNEVLEADREIALVVVEDEEGLFALPAFTSEEALLRWQPEGTPYVGLQGKALIEMLAGSDWDRIVVDTQSPDAFAITRAAALGHVGAVPYSAPAGSTILIGEPAQEPPAGLVRALQSACQHEPDVAEAFVYQSGILERNEPPHLTIGLRLDPGRDDESAWPIAESIGDAIDPSSWGYEFVDFQFLKGDMLETVRNTTSAVYERGTP